MVTPVAAATISRTGHRCARYLRQRCCVLPLRALLLDEPTNDLDVDTLRALEAGLESFPGCAVVISHDRWLLDRIATLVLAFEGDSAVRWFEATSLSKRSSGTESWGLPRISRIGSGTSVWRAR
jgi:ATPase subunit of ABC transporter with duplicated ATPase domains